MKNYHSAAHKDEEPALPLPTEVSGPHSLVTTCKDSLSLAPTFVTHQVFRKVKTWIHLTSDAFQVPITPLPATWPPAWVQSCHSGKNDIFVKHFCPLWESLSQIWAFFSFVLLNFSFVSQTFSPGSPFSSLTPTKKSFSRPKSAEVSFFWFLPKRWTFVLHIFL